MKSFKGAVMLYSRGTLAQNLEPASFKLERSSQRRTSQLLQGRRSRHHSLDRRLYSSRPRIRDHCLLLRFRSLMSQKSVAIKESNRVVLANRWAEKETANLRASRLQQGSKKVGLFLKRKWCTKLSLIKKSLKMYVVSSHQNDLEKIFKKSWICLIAPSSKNRNHVWTKTNRQNNW